MFLDDMCILCQSVSKDIKELSSVDDDGLIIEEKIKYVIATEQNLTSFNTVIAFRPNKQKKVCIRCIFYINQTCKFRQECQKNLQALSSYIEKIIANFNGIILPSTLEQTKKIENEGKKPKANNISQNGGRHTQMGSKKPSQIVEIQEGVVEMTDSLSDGLQPIRDIIKDIKNEEISLHHELIIKDEPPIEINIDTETTNPSQNTAQPAPKEQSLLEYLEEHIPPEARQKFDRCKICHRTPTGENLYKCGQCGKSYHQIRTLIDHVRTHTIEKTFTCNICDRGFNRKDGLTVHLQRHRRYESGERPYECGVCHKRFIQQENLRKHQKRHKSFSCDICKENFFTRFSLESHQRVHVQLRPFKCPKCPATYARKDLLKVHLKSHVGADLFVCQFCPFKSADNSSVDLHVKQVHAVLPTAENGSETESCSPDPSPIPSPELIILS